MLGIVLLVLSLYFYFRPRYRYLSYLLYLSFMLGYGGGFGLLTDEILGIKNKDLAIVYTFVISVFLILKNQYKLPNFKFVLWYKLFLLFLFCCVGFSSIHYGFSFYQILQGGRDFLLIFSLPILIRIELNELKKIICILLWITVATSVLYILQIIVGKPLMPYANIPLIDSSTGLIRLYNSPALLGFFLVLTFIRSQYFGAWINVFRFLFLVALICTLGRTGIFSTIVTVFLSIYFLGKTSKLIKTFVIVGLLLFPFGGLVIDRFEQGNTSDDISALLNGHVVSEYNGEGGTLTYRIAWVYERLAYLMDRPLGEQIFGLGLISDSQPIVLRKYDFAIGLINDETGFPYQLTTPDISYGNLVSRLGIVGTIIYLGFLISMTLFLLKNRNRNFLVLIAAAQMIMLFVNSISSSGLSEPKNLVLYFVILSTIFRNSYVYAEVKNRCDVLYEKIKK